MSNIDDFTQAERIAYAESNLTLPLLRNVDETIIGTWTFESTLTADAFVGDGSGLTGLSAGGGWESDGTNIKLATITDNVNIGVADGDGKLNVLATTEQFRLSYDATNYMNFIVADDGHTTIATVDPDGAEADINLNPDGNVGIKTAAPPEAFSVTGDVAILGDATNLYLAYDSASADHDVTIYFGDDGNNTAHWFRWNDGESTFEFSGDIKTGEINTASTTSTGLTVRHTGNLSQNNLFNIVTTAGSLIDNNANQAALNLAPTIAQTSTGSIDIIKVNTTLTTLGDGSTGDGNNLLNLSVSDAVKFKVSTVGDVTADGDMVVSGTLTTSGDVTIGGDLIVTGSESTHGEMDITGGAAYTINTTNVWHGYTGFSSGHLTSKITFAAGKTASDITTYATHDAGATTKVTTTAAHGLVANQIITITGTTNYNNIYEVQESIDANNFSIDKAWDTNNDATGTYALPSCFIIGTDGGGDYLIQWAAGGSAAAADTYEFGIYHEKTLDHKIPRKFPNNDVGAWSGCGIVVVADTDVLWFGIINTSGTNNIDIDEMSFVIHKL